MDQAATEARIGYSAPALEKGLDIIELLAAEGTPMTAKQVSERLGRSKNEIFRMVYVLVERGYLHRDAATDQLTLSNRLFELGMRTPRSRTLVEVALPVMQRLSNSIGHATHLVVINRGETVVIATAVAPAEFNFSLQLGYGNAAIDAVSGRTIIAFQMQERRSAMIDESLALMESKPSRRAVEEQLDQIAADGSVVATSHFLVGVIDICAPVLDKAGRAIASIVVPCLQQIGPQEDWEATRRQLVSACDEISNSLL